MLYAHYDRETDKKEELIEHLKNVSVEMEKGLETVSFSDAYLQKGSLARIGMYHDIGKSTKWFQEYLLTGHYENVKKKTHALLSAVIYSKAMRTEKNSASVLSAIAITNHHNNLSTDLPTEFSFDYLNEQYINAIDNLKRSEMKSWIIGLDVDDNLCRRFKRFWKKEIKKIVEDEHQSPEAFFALQFQFSKLISADKRSSAGIVEWGKGVPCGDIDQYIVDRKKTQLSSINDIRSEIRKIALGTVQDMSEQQISQNKIFTLTAPTGTGKTLTSLSVAMKLKERCYSIYGVEPHIITVVPFLNILEQIKTDYEQIFGEVLIDSSAVTVNLGNEDTDSMSLQAKQLLADSWMAPVVLSTFVQFFESVLSGEQGKLLKFQRFANAIVIMDEIQALEVERYPLYSVVIDMLAKCLGTRFILMTATQPKMFECADVYQYKVQARTELLSGYEKYFCSLDRTKLIPIMNQVNDYEQLLAFIDNHVPLGKKVLIVVNRIADSIQLYNLLKKQGFDTLYLSTNITGHDRKLRIHEASKRLNNNSKETFIMVSTQTIEAGVDLDFDIAFRDLAPMASIIQTAGRVNRSGNKEKHSPVYVFSTGSGLQIYNTLAVQLTAHVLGENPVLEKNYQILVEQYYDLLIEKEVFSYDQEKIYEKGILALDYSIINQFEMIKKQDRCSVFIIQNEEARECIRALCELLSKSDSSFEDKMKVKRLFRILGQYSVDIFINKLMKNQPCEFSAYCESISGKKIFLPYFVVAEDDLERFYNETGFIAEETGIFLF